MKAVLPTRAIGLLIGLGLLDLVATAVLHQRGLIVELNPLMRPFIERSELLFSLVKGFTLVFAWFMMARYAQISDKHLLFVRKSCIAGAGAYASLWTIWFLAAAL